ncbi:hypothetical protein FISHEDRAFT_42090, partial [Fistulina hepatica ATCC 64428]
SWNGTSSHCMSCPHETWTKLSLDHPVWLSLRKFTLRASWPASYPVDVFLDIFDPEAASTHLQEQQYEASQTSDMKQTRNKYARTRLVNIGVPVPGRHVEDAPVPFMLILEPLHLGILPESVIPTLIFGICVLSLTSYFVVPWVQRYLESVVRDYRRELRNTVSDRKYA